MFRSYLRFVNRYTAPALIAQTSFLMGLGDVIAQKVVEKRKWDPVRTAQYAGLGMVLIGPAGCIWYPFLKKYVGKSTDRPVTVALKKMAVDQFVYAPAFMIFFLPVLGWVKGKTWEVNKSDCKNQYVDLILSNWLVWPPIQIINFLFVPVNVQLIFVQVFAVLWNTFLSWRTSRHHDDERRIVKIPLNKNKEKTGEK